jgi:predicted PurR-regulated permease PerM
MRESVLGSPPDRARIGWWLFVLLLGAVATYIAYSFVGMIALGVFGYYATRPINRRVERVVDSEGAAAWMTVLLVLLPLVGILFYAGSRLFTQVRAALGESGDFLAVGDGLGVLPAGVGSELNALLSQPRQLLTDPEAVAQTALEIGVGAAAALFGALLLVGLALTLSYFLLENDHELEDGLRQLFGGRDTTAYAYAAAVDEDLESVFFGNFLFLVVMAVVATLTYWATNLVAPEGLGVPMIFVLGFLTGVTSLVPVVVGKIVYLPVVGLLAVQAVGGEETQLGFVAAVLVAYFLVLDVLPQTFLQPYITGRRLDVVVMMFAYLLGPVLFGWYGFFLLPILFVLMLEAVRIVLPELVHGEAVTPAVEMGDSVGTTPRTDVDAVPDESVASDDGTTTGDGDASRDAAGDGPSECNE